MIIVAVVFILKSMIELRRLVKKSTMRDILKLPFADEIEILSRKADQKNTHIVSVYISLNRTLTKNEIEQLKCIMTSLLDKTVIVKSRLSIIKTSIKDGFIKECSYRKLGIPIDPKYDRLCRIYCQNYFCML